MITTFVSGLTRAWKKDRNTRKTFQISNFIDKQV